MFVSHINLLSCSVYRLLSLYMCLCPPQVWFDPRADQDSDERWHDLPEGEPQHAHPEVLCCPPQHQRVPRHCAQSLHWDSGRHCRWLFWLISSYLRFTSLSIYTTKLIVLHRAGKPDGREIWFAIAYQFQYSSRFLHPDEAWRSGLGWRETPLTVY